MTTCILIGAPVDCGKRRLGCLMGPDAYRAARLPEALRALGHEVEDRGNLRPAPHAPDEDDQFLHKLHETIGWTESLMQAAQAGMADGVPVFLGGDHALALGTVPGVAAHAATLGKPLFVLWLDAHTDYHTLQTTDSGNLHGTPVGYFTGRAGFDGFPVVAHPVPLDQVCMIGLRSVDPAEKAALEGSGMARHDMRDIDENGIVKPLSAFLDRVAAAGGLLHVSLDVDFIDPAYAPGVGTTVPGGVTVREAHLVMEMIHESGLMRSLDLVELNPFLDDRGQTANLMVDLVASAFGRTVVDHMMGLVHHIGLASMLRGLAAYIADDFARWEAFDKTPRVAAHSDVGVIELMPTSDGQAYGFKYVNGHPKNTAQGLQTVTAFGLLADVATGYPVLLTEMTLLTALRTAAMSALAAKHLAPKGATCMAMIGNGAQSEFQSLAMQAICGIDTVRLYDIDPAATAKCAANLRSTGLTVVTCATAEEALLGAQILTTCTADKRNATILTGNMVGSGVHINAIGGDCPGKTEIAPDILQRADIFVEFPPQTRVEGDIQQLAPDHPVTELWRVIAGQTPGRTSPGQLTLFDSVGFAIEDFSALRFVRDHIDGTGFFTPLDMLADPDDPRDLFGMLRRAAPDMSVCGET